MYIEMNNNVPHKIVRKIDFTLQGLQRYKGFF